MAASLNFDDAAAHHYFASAAEASPVYFERAYRNLAIVSEKLQRQSGLRKGS